MRIPPSEDRRSVQQQVPCDQEAGLGPFLHGLALLGHDVSEALFVSTREGGGGGGEGGTRSKDYCLQIILTAV